MVHGEATELHRRPEDGVARLDRLVYKLVRVGEDGNVLPSADDDDEMPDDKRSDDGAVNLEEEKTKLLERLKILDTILYKVKPDDHLCFGQCRNKSKDVLHPNTIPHVEEEGRVYTRPSSDCAKEDEQLVLEAEPCQKTHFGEPNQHAHCEVEPLAIGDAYFSLSATQIVEGKRKPKPNRRYIEDGTESLYFVSDVHRLIVDGNDHFDSLGGDTAEKAASESDVDYTGFESPTRLTISRSRRRIVKRKAAKLARLAWSSHKRATTGSFKKEKLGSPDKELCSDLDTENDQMVQEDMQGYGDFTDQQVETVPTPNGGTRRKHHRPWTLREVMILIEGVTRCGGGKWADIKKLEFSSVSYRTAVDLKDKWRNLLRASRVHFASKQAEQRKKHFAASIPQPILARVRELAASHCQQPSITLMTRTSRRTARRK